MANRYRVGSVNRGVRRMPTPAQWSLANESEEPRKSEDTMGTTLCSRHGPAGIAHVCLHICSTVTSYSPVTEFEEWKCIIMGDFEIPYWFCPQCFATLRSKGLPDSGFPCESEEDDAMIEQIFAQFDVNQIVCNPCLEDCIAMGRVGGEHCE
jgi:hypothetical protein